MEYSYTFPNPTDNPHPHQHALAPAAGSRTGARRTNPQNKAKAALRPREAHEEKTVSHKYYNAQDGGSPEGVVVHEHKSATPSGPRQVVLQHDEHCESLDSWCEALGRLFA